MWRVKLVAKLQAGVTTETEVARIERSEEAGLADLGLRLDEAKQLTAALQAEMVSAQLAAVGEQRRSCATCGRPLASKGYYRATDWWHAAVRFEHALQAARSLGVGAADAHLVRHATAVLERAKWCLWHGRWTGCRRKLASLCCWTKRKPVRDMAGIDRLQRHVSDLLGYLERNQGALVPYAARRRRGEPISTAFVESAVKEIVATRMNK